MKREKGSVAWTNQLLDLPCFDEIISVTEIAQGLSHCCFKVNTTNQVYFAKYLEKRSTAETESIMSKLAADKGLSPAVYFANDEWLITEFVDANSLANIAMPIEDKLKVLIELMLKCHSLKPSLPILDIEVSIDKLVQAGKLSQQQRQVITRIKNKLCACIEVKAEVVCHGDFNFSNILTADQVLPSADKILSLKPPLYSLIDFECSCWADVEFDLAMMMAVNEIPLKHLDDVVEQYKNNSQRSRDLDMFLVTRYLLFSHLINGLWYYQVYCDIGDNTLLNKANYQFKSIDTLGLINESLLQEMR